MMNAEGGLDLGSGISDMGAERMGGSQGLEQCVPVASLGIPGEGEQMENPEVGDAVDYQVSGKVTRIEGDKAYVMPESVNGQPVKDLPESPAADPMAELQSQAEGMGYLG